MKESKNPLYATLGSIEDIVRKDGFWFFPSLKGKRFMISTDSVSRIEVQDNRPKEA